MGQDIDAVVPTLTALLASKEKDARYVAADTLGKIGPAARVAIPALVEAIDDPEFDVSQAAVEAIRTIDVEIAVQLGLL